MKLKDLKENVISFPTERRAKEVEMSRRLTTDKI